MHIGNDKYIAQNLYPRRENRSDSEYQFSCSIGEIFEIPRNQLPSIVWRYARREYIGGLLRNFGIFL